jgi:hypothetical protein
MILVIEGHEVKVARTVPLVSSSVNIYEAEFRFDSSWDGYTKTAVFAAGKTAVAVLLTSNKCTIPWEVLQSRGSLRIGVYGVSGDKVRPTIWSETLSVAEGVDDGDAPQEPTPTVYEMLLTELAGLDTRVGNLERNGGGGGGGGGTGLDGVGIESIEQTTTSTADKGVNVITVTLTDGTVTTFEVRNGSKGSPGTNGTTPVRGTDYWTDADKAEIKSYVDTAILGGAW